MHPDFFTGFGRNKRIALFDTLIENHSVEELTGVLAHEIGHVAHRHGLQAIKKSRVTAALSTLALEGAKNLGGQDLAALGRQGFAYEIARRVVDSEDPAAMAQATEDLRQTEITQPVLLTASTAAGLQLARGPQDQRDAQGLLIERPGVLDEPVVEELLAVIGRDDDQGLRRLTPSLESRLA